MQRGLPHAEALPGFEKIRGACRQAAGDGFNFVWVDTCCIDNSSSAEFSEAINSMFRWYSDAEICYAYLFDVVEVGDGPEADSQFRNSRWFTRGWTLQELLALKKVMFYSRAWVEMGSEKEFATRISEITGIDSEALGTLDITRFSVAERMSWASGRVTTRQEDIAYCLLGLFGVNMALLYGKGERAFVRLEEEIIKVSDDHSIFAWTSSSEAPCTTSGLLATSPLQFKHSRGIIPYEERITAPVANIRSPNAFMLDETSPSFRLATVYQYKPDNAYPLTRRHEIVCTYGHGGGVLVNIPESVNDWVAAAIFKSTTTTPEVWVMLGWTDEFGASIHVCEGIDENSHAYIIEKELGALGSRIVKREIMHEFRSPVSETKRELVPVSASVDTQHEQGIDALYKVLHKVTVTDDRYVAIDSKQETT